MGRKPGALILTLVALLFLFISCNFEDKNGAHPLSVDPDSFQNIDDDDSADSGLDDDTSPMPPIGDPDYVDVFVSMDGRYPIYRIPSLITTDSGTLLAFAEGRQSTNDHSKNDIVMRRSTDGGYTWGELIVLSEEGDDCLSDPVPVLIKTGANKGRILLVYTRFPFGCHHDCVEPGFVGPKSSRNYILHSDDDGLTWSDPVDFSTSVKREEANYSSSGPGFGVQKRHGAFAGRIILPYREGNPVKVYAVYSDDGGNSWTMGHVADDSQTKGRGNEVQIVELPDGSLYMNTRSAGGTKHRKVARSYDGGETWTPLVDDPVLVEPQVMASILQFSDPADGERGRLLYSGPNNKYERLFGQVRLSYDSGISWPQSKIVWPGIFAYSVLTRIDCNTVGLIFEDDIFLHHLTLARFSIPWLTDGADWVSCD